ncbi:hypothetical protein AVEN_91420-1 [Araneus ventricosus]|uniref:Uncharacterized protein n=1 Tax=Araneus ventricosus TaxID=182803 RepID=A0A4Y2IHQ7_ARAVE|nr:hypothetical protein AVEN_91420-1 [Araneus ventricosus]
MPKSKCLLGPRCSSGKVPALGPEGSRSKTLDLDSTKDPSCIVGLLHAKSHVGGQSPLLIDSAHTTNPDSAHSTGTKAIGSFERGHQLRPRPRRLTAVQNYLRVASKLVQKFRGPSRNNPCVVPKRDVNVTKLKLNACFPIVNT